MSADETELDDIFAAPVSNDWSDWGMLINEQPSLSPVYRIQERDERNGPRCTLAKGDGIKFSRIVVRVGYEFGVHSITKTEWWQAGLEMTAQRAGLSTEDVKKVILALSLSAPFKNLRASIYEAKIRPLTQKGNLRNVRAMWFYDYPKPQRGYITGRVTRLTGKRQPGRPSGDCGWDPPTLERTHSQRLYEVRIEPDGYDSSWGAVMVYPDDVEVKP